MKHPIYRNSADRNMLSLINKHSEQEILDLLLPSFLSVGQTENHCRAYVNRLGAMHQVELNGCNLIQLKDAEHWNESLSEKTLAQMKVDDLLLPFPAFTIDLTSAEWTKYEYLHVVKDEKLIMFTFEVDENGGNRYHQLLLEYGKGIAEEVDETCKHNDTIHLLDIAVGTFKGTMRNALYKCFSIILYTSMFQKVTDKVEIIKTVNKGSKKRNIPNHNTHVIYLSQPSYKLKGKAAADGSRGSSDKTWMQKGHFRRQPYGSRKTPQYKSIWIDAMWKGQGSKVISKSYKV